MTSIEIISRMDRSIIYISRTAHNSKLHWATFDLEAGSIVWSTKRLREDLWRTTIRMFLDFKALENVKLAAEH